MNCHGNNDGNQGNNKPNHSPIKHMLHMILCCGLPVVIIGLLPFISTFSPGASKFLSVITPFICPIMMLSMIPMMLGNRGNKKSSCCGTKNENNIVFETNTQIDVNEQQLNNKIEQNKQIKLDK